ncbi:MAG: DUF6249 domain-containing protein [Tannerella sp.]|jgi:Ca2+/Na+ antiporter|nr:DUF6249 domain-containing protein [Tannerella sp.]
MDLTLLMTLLRLDIGHNTFVALMFPVMCIMAIAIVWITSAEKKKRYELEADLYAKAIERGQELPGNLFDRLGEKKRKKSSLEKGIILISVGAGISLFFLVIALTDAPHADRSLRGMAIGIIPFAIGVGHLLIHFLEKKKQHDRKDEE